MSGKKRQSTLFNFFSKQTSEVQKENSANEDPKKTAEESDEECRPKKRGRIAALKDSSESESESEKKSSQKGKSKEKQTSKKRKIGATGKENGDGPEKKPNLHKFLSVEEKEGSGSLQPSTDNVDRDVAIDDPLSNNCQNNITYIHDSLEFLKPEKIRDIEKRKPSDPEFDSRTLYVPESFLNSQTPVMFQWWQFKSRHMDTLLFLKVGKFYELYHMDAVIGVQELGFSYMKGDIAHSGFPESAYGKMASQLIEKGYKVARIEQTETPEMMESRLKGMKKPTKYDRVVQRELCQISSIGSMIYTAQLQDSKNKSPHYMYAICIKNCAPHTLRIGVCFAEISIGSFHLTEFEDDKHFSKLLVLLNEYPVSLILTERGGINKSFNELLEVTFRDVKKEYMSPKTQFYTASDTLEKLAESSYFKDTENKLQWPDLFKKLADNYSPKKEYELAISSLGACLWYLKDCHLDIQVFSTAKFEWYDSYDQVNTKYSKGYMILDSATITNLNLLHSVDSLENILNHCSTPFGHRLLHRWICRPLYDVVKIKERQNAVRELRNNPDLLKRTQTILSLLPDLERQLTKIRIYGNKSVVSNHPDGRAIFYEELTYSKRKIEDFIQTIEAFERVQEIPDIFKSCEDTFLQQITQYKPIGINIDLRDTITHIKSAVDLEQAAKDGRIIPKKGFVKNFDEVEDKIQKIQQELDDYLQKQCQIFGCKVTYVGNKKNRYQLNIPANKCHKISAEYQLQSGSTKSATIKYSTSETTRLLAAMIKAECERSKVILDLNRCIFEKFGERHDEMNQVIQCLAILDIICGFAEYAYKYPHDICMPEILSPCDKPKIAISNGRNPCVDNASFVPNDTFLGQDEYPSLLLLTGPNMGGKSTLIKQTALIAIMAHIGSFVPASACEMNLIDRIFTRLGAQDDIIEGQSTFYTELSETSMILKNATKNSFVLIDELGRGTSTHDGNAIATAVVTKIASFKCRGIFSTHFHSLVDRFEGQEDIQIGHMACMEENEDSEVTEESIIFLFKLAKGRCSKSYGFNVAKLAGVDKEVVASGCKIAKQTEEKVLNRLEILKLFTE